MIEQANWRNNHVLRPLFWQRGDSHEALREEMVRMKENGINDFILEARPHPDYLGPGWWEDLAYILGLAEDMDMLVWIFDDGDYPSGTAKGALAREYPECTKRYWAENHMDASGPLPHAHFLIDDWLKPGETVYKVLAARRVDRGEVIDSDTLTDITDRVAHGRLYWSVPEGEWRVFLVKITPWGQEEHTRDYVDPMSRESVAKYIELVHEKHYEHFAPQFGRRIAGFFTDEPRFGNITGYDRIVGKSRMPLPYTPGMEKRLDGYSLGDFGRLIPLLWYEDAQGLCHDVRYAYMDTVSRLFAENFTGQLGTWCRDHGVRLIGHLVEENGAHTRLGYGSGHFFRCMEGLDAAGIDVVSNLFPEQTDGVFSTAFNEFDCDFSHWGLAKMASSDAQLDPKKNGDTFCEAFGAYGWHEGLRLMKWITDHLAVQGVNIITPHAFSPSPFPDPDCPPHFYARGENPQFRLFHVWSDYANRLLGTLLHSRLIAPVAVVYHAEAEWGGECEPFEKAVKALARRQIDSMVVPADVLTSDRCEAVDGELRIGAHGFRAVVAPYAQFVPQALADALARFARSGVPVVFTRALPERAYFGGEISMPWAKVSATEDLPDLLAPFADITCEPSDPDLLYAHFRKNGRDMYLFVNQSTRRAVDARVRFRESGEAALYDALDNRCTIPQQWNTGEGTEARVRLLPYESRLAVFGDDAEGLPEETYDEPSSLVAEFADGWRIGCAASKAYPDFASTPFTRVGDMALPDRLPDFSGTLRYEHTFTLQTAEDLILDLGDAYEAVAVWVNGQMIGERICPPYRLFVPASALRAGENELRVEVTNTLVHAHHDNPFDCYFVQNPTGLVDPVRLLKP